ncbi:MAG TPA: type II/IV secretion system protein [Gemmatimonadales bacterium]|nr:type II/IV secretion system protein [Gemmatimonadales bacterium]
MSFTDAWLTTALEPLLPPGKLDELRPAPDQPQVSLWQKVTSAGLLTEDQVLKAAAERYRFPLAELVSVQASKVKDAIPESLARRFGVVPTRVTDSVLEVGTANPFDLEAEKMLAFATGREVRMQLAAPGKIAEKLEEIYRPENVVENLLQNLEEQEVTQIDEEVEEADDLLVSTEEASARPVVRLVDAILSEGILARASDIHIEPAEGGVVVRYRIDGVLVQKMKIPRAAGVPLISRIKIISSLDIADRLRPQDGRARVAVNGQAVDLRVSTLPASYGEKVVIRILNAQATALDLEALGLFPDEIAKLQELLENKDGIILVTGPTGSGKTTTLYSALRYVQDEGVNIVTVEDPVEYRLSNNIVQVQVNPKAGLTFSSALRSILRQDPDVVLIGEIRDQETGSIAVQASLTGHLVLSTLHTNDAPNAVTRLVDMGLEGFKIASALRGVVAQRLMRRLCNTCREVSTEPVPEKLRKHIPGGATLYRAVGCPECAMTGFRGRFSVVEVMTMTPELEKRIGANAPPDRLAEAARDGGMKTLWDCGLRHVLEGHTSVDELLRVTDVPVAAAPAPAKPAPAPRSTPAAGTNAILGTTGAHATPVTDVLEGLELVDEDGAAPAASGAAGRGRTVLVVDDEDHLRRLLCDLLEREGYKTIEARDGGEAITRVDQHAPDVVLLDLNLPGLDGYGVLAQLRSRSDTRGLPVVVLTAKGDEDNEVRVLQAGADDFLTKPFRARALYARLEKILHPRRVG